MKWNGLWLRAKVLYLSTSLQSICMLRYSNEDTDISVRIITVEVKGIISFLQTVPLYNLSLFFLYISASLWLSFSLLTYMLPLWFDCLSLTVSLEFGLSHLSLKKGQNYIQSNKTDQIIRGFFLIFSPACQPMEFKCTLRNNDFLFPIRLIKGYLSDDTTRRLGMMSKIQRFV